MDDCRQCTEHNEIRDAIAKINGRLDSICDQIESMQSDARQTRDHMAQVSAWVEQERTARHRVRIAALELAKIGLTGALTPGVLWPVAVIVLGLASALWGLDLSPLRSLLPSALGG